MHLLPIAAVAGAFALGGCSSAQTIFGDGTVAEAAPTATRDAEKALTIAHLAYQAAGVTLAQAAQSGALKGANAATAQVLYDKAGIALALADQADAAANAQGVLAQVASVEALIAQITALIPK
jgi:hypothetical protein